MSDSIQAMNAVLGKNYHIFTSDGTDPIVLAKLPDEDLAQKNSVDQISVDSETHLTSQLIENEPIEKTNDDYLFQIYLGSMTVVGLFVLFRMIQKST